MNGGLRPTTYLYDDRAATITCSPSITVLNMTEDEKKLAAIREIERERRGFGFTARRDS